MCRPCALHPRQSLIALNVCRAWRLWWRDIPWRLLRWMLLKHTNGAILQLCFVLFWKKFTSVLSLCNDRCICLSLWQVHASISRITATRSEMPKGRDGRHGHGYMDMVGSNSYFAIVNYWYWCAQFQTSLTASQYLSPSHRLRSDRETAVGTAWSWSTVGALGGWVALKGCIGLIPTLVF